MELPKRSPDNHKHKDRRYSGLSCIKESVSGSNKSIERIKGFGGVSIAHKVNHNSKNSSVEKGPLESTSCPKLSRKTINNYYYHGKDYFKVKPDLILNPAHMSTSYRLNEIKPRNKSSDPKYSKFSLFLMSVETVQLSQNFNQSGDSFRSTRYTLTHRPKKKRVKIGNIIKIFQEKYSKRINPFKLEFADTLLKL
jgi:hypothetical protein